MDGLSTGDRLEVELVRFRAEIDQKFAGIERAILDTERRIFEGIGRELKATRRFVATTTISVASVSLGIMIPMLVTVLLRT
jgi:hypothetical protein